MPKKKKTPCVIVFLLLGLSILCLLAILLVTLPDEINSRAEMLLGPASSTIHPLEKMAMSSLLLLRADQLNQPKNPMEFPKSFTIEQGDSVHLISERLYSNGLIHNPALFRVFLKYSGMDRSIQAGEYNLSAGMSSIEIARAIQEFIPQTVEFYLYPGWRIEEIAAALKLSGLQFEEKRFIQLAKNPSEIPDLSLEETPPMLEGYLFPGNYTFSRESSAEEIIQMMVNNFTLNITDALLLEIAQKQMSLYEVLTIASVVEREAVIDVEKTMIASVYLNRYKIGMKLDADPTIQYALGFDGTSQTWWKNKLTLTDLQINSLYNTYLHAGLPPSPISNPDIDSILAVVSPLDTSYLYFRATCDGSGKHEFSVTYEEHQSKGCP